MSDYELEDDEFVCVTCDNVAIEHLLDGLGECRDCAETATIQGIWP